MWGCELRNFSVLDKLLRFRICADEKIQRSLFHKYGVAVIIFSWSSRPGRKLGKLGNIRNLGNIIPSFLISKFSILPYSQNWKLGFKNLRKKFPSFPSFWLGLLRDHFSSRTDPSIFTSIDPLLLDRSKENSWVFPSIEINKQLLTPVHSVS